MDDDYLNELDGQIAALEEAIESVKVVWPNDNFGRLHHYQERLATVTFLYNRRLAIVQAKAKAFPLL